MRRWHAVHGEQREHAHLVRDPEQLGQGSPMEGKVEGGRVEEEEVRAQGQVERPVAKGQARQRAGDDSGPWPGRADEIGEEAICRRPGAVATSSSMSAKVRQTKRSASRAMCCEPTASRAAPRRARDLSAPRARRAGRRPPPGRRRPSPFRRERGRTRGAGRGPASRCSAAPSANIARYSARVRPHGDGLRRWSCRRPDRRCWAVVASENCDRLPRLPRQPKTSCAARAAPLYAASAAVMAAVADSGVHDGEEDRAGGEAGQARADRWTVRGVPAKLQKAAGDAARARGLTLGQWLSEVLSSALPRRGVHRPRPRNGGKQAVEQRLARLEAAVFDRTSAARPSAAAAAAARPS